MRGGWLAEESGAVELPVWPGSASSVAVYCSVAKQCGSVSASKPSKRKQPAERNSPDATPPPTPPVHTGEKPPLSTLASHVTGRFPPSQSIQTNLHPLTNLTSPMDIDQLDLPVHTLEKSPSPYPYSGEEPDAIPSYLSCSVFIPGKKDATLQDKPIPLPSMIHDTGAWAEIHCSHYLTGPAHLYKLSNMGVPTDTIGLPGTSVTGQQYRGRLPHLSSVWRTSPLGGSRNRRIPEVRDGAQGSRKATL